MTGLPRLTKVYLALVTFSIIGSLFSHVFHFNPGPIAPVAALLTLLAGVAAVYAPLFATDRDRTVKGLLAVAALGAVAELIGSKTGIPFGRYRYTDAWWPTVGLPGGERFPIQVPFAWALLVGAATFGVGASTRFWPRVLLSASVASLCDLVLEPSLSGSMGYWQWLEHGPLPGSVPVLNSCGWFLVSAAGAAILIYLRLGSPDDRYNSRVVLGAHVLLVASIGGILSG